MKALSTLFFAAVLSATASQALAQTNDTGRALVPSSTIRLAADTERCNTSVGKEFIVPYAGTVRVAYLIKSDGTHNANFSVFSSIHSCQNSFISSGAYALQVCDVRVAEGDSVRVNAMTFTSSHVCLKNVHVLYNVINATGLGRVILN